MALVVKDRVKQTSTTTGTGSIVLNGTVAGFQTFTSALTDGDTTYYAIVEPSTGSWEVGLGTWTESTATLARTTVLESSNSGSAINLTAQSEVFITQPASKAVYTDASGNLNPAGNVDVAGTLDVTGAATFDDSVTIQGDLTVNGTTTTVNATNLAVADNMIYLNDGSTTTNPDLGWAGNYNDGTYAHAGIFRDASDATFKFYDGYVPEPGIAIDTTHATFSLADVDTGNLDVTGNITVSGTVDGRDVAADGTKLDGIETGATGDQTASEILTAIKTVDGATSGLDADLLDGQEGSYYLDWTHTTNKPDPTVTLSGDVSGSATMTDLGSINITTTVANDSHTHDGRYYTETEVGNFFAGTTAITGYNKTNWDTAYGWGDHAAAGYLAASSYTAADVLTKIKTVDGSGSGLDADLLDGTQLSAITRSGSSVALTGAVTGSTTVAADGSISIATTATSDPTLTLSGDATGSATFTNLGNATLTVTVVDDSHNHVISNVDGLQTALDGKLSTSGTAANSNLLDGLDSTQFLRSDTSDTMTGTLTVTGDVYASAAQFIGGFGAVTTSGTLDWNDATNARSGNGYTLLLGTATNGPGVSAYFHPFSFEYASKNGGGNLTQFAIPYNTTDGPYFRYRFGGTWTSWVRLWNNTNDGSGSGLDADLWDGQQFASYLNQAVLTSSSPTFANINVAANIIHSGDTNTYIGFHAADQWRIVTGGAERFEVNNSDVTVQSALKEKYVALSGTTPSIDVDAGGGFSLTTSGNTTFTFTAFNTNLSCGFVLQLTAGGTHTITWPASFDWAGGTAPDAPASGETDIYVFWSRDGGTTWYGVQSIDAAA